MSVAKALTVATVVGARPQFIKAAVVSRRLREHGTREILLHTGQHYDDGMSEVFFRQLGLPAPDENLGIGSAASGAQTGRMIEAIEAALLRHRPDVVVVYGDTNSTMAGALAAVKLQIPVAHIEAGLRSFNRRMPEEINRVVTDHVASLHFAPTTKAVRNLADEGVTSGVHLVGDVMYDCVLEFGREAARESRVLADRGLDPRGFHLATVHRADNTDDHTRLRAIVAALDALSASGTPVIWPVHPRTKAALSTAGISPDGATRLIPPVSYFDLQTLIAASRCVITDSGGMQKEAFFHRVPCVILRDETEWVELAEGGFSRIAGADTSRIIECASTAVFPDGATPPLYGDGDAARKIVAVLCS